MIPPVWVWQIWISRVSREIRIAYTIKDARKDARKAKRCLSLSYIPRKSRKNLGNPPKPTA